jgi:hypothetical protein
MNYQKIYNQIIERATNRKILDGYVEKHHVLPKSLGGSNDTSNIALLTAREHFICHLLLAKIHGGKMWHAAWRMSCDGKHGSRKYEWLRIKHANLISMLMRGRPKSDKTKEKLSNSHKGKKHSIESKRKMSKLRTGKKFSAEWKENISKSLRGKKHSEVTKQKLRKPKSDVTKQKMRKPKSDVTKQKMSYARTGRKLSEEWKENIRKSMIAFNKKKKP